MAVEVGVGLYKNNITVDASYVASIKATKNQNPVDR